MKNTYIISLGGSLIVPREIDWKYLKKFKQFVEKEVKLGNRLVIVIGGGATARKYRDAGKGVVKALTLEDLDWLGIHATRLNAHLIRTIFRDIAYHKILTNPNERHNIQEKVIVAAGYWPGHSTDYDAVMHAKKFKAKSILNLSNIDYVYTKDPKKPGAKRIEKISWKDFRKIVGNKWDPGLHAPFDPIASREAQKMGLRVMVLNGKDFENIKKALKGARYKGTIIEG